MIPFNYRKISHSFIDELSEKLCDGQSVVLLGPRFGGKRYVLDRLNVQLQTERNSPLVSLSLLRQPSMANEQKVYEWISQAVASADKDVCLNGQSADNFLEPIDQLFMKAQKAVFLLGANVDGMAYHLTSRFLEGVQRRVKNKELIVALTGEHDFRDLVHGPKSEFNCAEVFVLQGFAEDEFTVFASRLAKILHIEFECPKNSYCHLWERTGGNVYLLRLLMWRLVERRSLSNGPHSLIRDSDIPRSLETRFTPDPYEADVLRHATHLVEREPECWKDLENLVNNSPTSPLRDAPGTLELAGVAVREGGQLCFASPMIQDFVAHYYDNRRLGDLYIRNGQWDEALKRHATLSPEERMRPWGVDDRADRESTIRALGTGLYLAATESVQEVKLLFARACRYVLGFQDISFWERDREWKLYPVERQPINQDTIGEIVKLLPTGRSCAFGRWPVPEEWGKYIVAALLPALRSDQQGAVVVGDFERRISISRERERSFNSLLKHFIDAYAHAVSMERDRTRLKVRNQHVEIINSIFEALGSRVLDVQHAIGMAAYGLRSIGYRRVLFCLVDPEGKRIQGVWNESDDKSVDVASMIDWPLDSYTQDLQPYVIRTREPKIVLDANEEPLANKEVVKRAQMSALAIIPILNRGDKAIGTIHVERADNTVPSREEVDDLLVFGRQLAIAIEQSERVNLLQAALDKMPEPVVIVDRLEYLRYANKPAAELFELQAGWKDRDEAQVFPEEKSGEIAKHLHEALTSQQRSVYHITGVGSNSTYRGAILLDHIEDWRDKTIGALMHIQDVNYLFMVLSAFQLVAGANDTQSAIRSILEATRSLGHPWGRLYLMDEADPDLLVSKLSFGFANPEAQARFDGEQVALPHRSESEGESWISIERRTPLVFSFWNDRGHLETVTTPQGLEVINIRNPNPEFLEKKPGDFWLDFPIITPKGVLGKLTLGCNKELQPEEFEMLKVLSEMFTGLLDSFLKRDRSNKEKMEVLVSGTEKSMASMAHNIGTRFASLPMLLRQYKEHEGRYSELESLDEDFAHILEHIGSTVTRAKELLGSVVLRPTEFDLRNYLHRSLKSALPEQSWSLECQESSFPIFADEHLLGNALNELFQNSKDATAELEHLQITVSVESKRAGASEGVKITYRDNGPGVPGEFKERIFEDFFSRRPGKKSGTGLGLGFVHRVIEAHGGRVWEQGRIREGAEFVIEMPRFANAPEKIEDGNHVSHSSR